jgi:hypothetical protein
VGMPDQRPLEPVSDCPCRTTPEIEGGAMFTGAELTTADLGEVAVADPELLAAVTVTLSVEPASAATAMYVAALAPTIGEQFAPALSQRNHWKVNEGAGDPLHVPGPAVSRLPTDALPITDGGEVLDGAELITAVSAEVAVTDPELLAAVTVTSSVEPASAARAVYVAALGPTIWEQFAPALSQRNHWKVNEGAGDPLHVPGPAVSWPPAEAVPVIEGAARLTGAVGGGLDRSLSMLSVNAPG